MMIELAVAHEATYPAQAKRYGNWLSKGIDSGLAAKPIDIGRTTILRDKFKGQLLRLFTDVDAILLPVFRGGTPTWDEVQEMTDNDMNSFMRFNCPPQRHRSPTVTDALRLHRRRTPGRLPAGRAALLGRRSPPRQPRLPAGDGLARAAPVLRQAVDLAA